MAEILFVTAPYHCGVVEVAGRWIPLQFCYLADAALQAGVRPIIYDAMSKMATHRQIAGILKAVKPKYLGLSSITATMPDVLKIASYAKRISPKTKVILGGVHPTFCAQEVFETSPDVDIVVIGEGEQTLKELLTALEKDTDITNVCGIAFRSRDGMTVTPRRCFLPQLEAFQPRFELLNWGDYRYFVIPGSRLGAVSTSRGCNHNCSFCSQQKFWDKTWRFRKPEDVAVEIERLYTKWNVNVILLTDEYPTKNRERWIELLERVKSLRHDDLFLLMETRVDDIVRDEDILPLYRDAGIIHVYVGVEATRQETLDLIHKDVLVDMGRQALSLLKKHGFISETSFVLGFPDETSETIANTLELAKYYDPDFAHFLAITPWPYADIYESLKPYIAVEDYSKYNLIDPIIEPEKMTLDEIDIAMIRCYGEFYGKRFLTVLQEKDEFKRQYMLRSMKLIMKSSFIVEKMKHCPLRMKDMEKIMKEQASKAREDNLVVSSLSVVGSSL